MQYYCFWNSTNREATVQYTMNGLLRAAFANVNNDRFNLNCNNNLNNNGRSRGMTPALFIHETLRTSIRRNLLIRKS